MQGRHGRGALSRGRGALIARAEGYSGERSKEDGRDGQHRRRERSGLRDQGARGGPPRALRYSYGMRTIRAGDSGDDVRDVQRRLVGMGSTLPADELMGLFGESTEKAVRAFQQRRALLVDGIVGSETWEELVEAGFA